MTHSRLLRALSLGLAAMVLTGCVGVRVDNGELGMPEADPAEQARQRQAMASDAIVEAIADLKSTAATEAQTEQISAIGDAATEHLAQLGGVWVAYPELAADGSTDAATDTTAVDATDQPSDVAASEVTPIATVSDLITVLRADAATARQDAETTVDGRLARLVAAVGVNREITAQFLESATSGAASVALPDLTPTPSAIPGGLSADALVAGILAEDSAGMVWEVVAARSSDAERDRAVALAAEHRARAEAWAVVAGLAGTDDDPRRSAYAVPDDVLTSGPSRTRALGDLELMTAETWLILAARAEPGERADLLEVYTAAATRAAALTGDVPDLPGWY